ncbi:MAG: glycosyltransferase family 2 protein [Dysgonamonadaceae bacterium]
MLSILIPVYNRNIRELVDELLTQCIKLNIEFEILALDDCSPLLSIRDENAEISHPFFRLIQLKQNIGNAEARNMLAKTARFDWLLFLDADMIPVNDNFIQFYTQFLDKKEFDIISGGIMYKEEHRTEFRLKWLHGRHTEEHQQAKDPFLEIRGNNFLIRKTLFFSNPLGGLPEKYGYVDTHFGLKLKKAGARIKIIENPCWHLGLETTDRFIDKTRMSLRNAYWMKMHEPELAENLRIIKTYRKLEKWHIKGILNLAFRYTAPFILRNIYSENPSLRLFQFYKLGYLCSLSYKKDIPHNHSATIS